MFYVYLFIIECKAVGTLQLFFPTRERATFKTASDSTTSTPAHRPFIVPMFLEDTKAFRQECTK